MGREAKFRKDLSMPGMVAEMRRCFERIEDAVSSRGVSLPDCLMSGLAIFALKYPSLLQFDRDARGLGEPSAREGNLRSLFGIGRAPSDSRMRERLDALDPEELRRPFRRLFALAQRGGVLKEYEWLGGRHVLSVDGTGHFSSPTVHCDNCCVKNRRDGSVEYYHQSLCAVLVHPERRAVLPVVPPEPILKTDGARKNDCERNASKRLLTALRREHPHLPLLVVEDGLASNGPHVRLLKDLGMSFVLGAKPGDHKALFAWVDELESAPAAPGAEPGVERWAVDADGAEHVFRWSNGAPLNDAHADLEVNFLEYWERRPNGRTRHFSWVADLRIDRWNAMDLMRAGRARWRIENETFNTLKNQGYEFEHNFGHGERHLATVFACLMMLAFGIDQLQKACCPLFRAAQARKGAGEVLLGGLPLDVHDVPPAGLGHVLPGPGLRPRGSRAGAVRQLPSRPPGRTALGPPRFFRGTDIAAHASGPGPEVGSCLLNRKTTPQPDSRTTRAVSGSTWFRT